MSKRLLPREKALKFGISSLEDYELLALILSVGSGKADVFTLSRRLAEEFGLEELSKLPLKALLQIEGIGTAKAVRLAAAFELGRRMYLRPDEVLNHEHVKRLLEGLARSRKEMLIVSVYDASGRFLGKEIVAVGTFNVLYVHLREIFEPLFRVGASKFILAHNHPDGSFEASPEDVEVSRKVAEIADALGFVLIESFVVGRDRALGILGGSVIRF